MAVHDFAIYDYGPNIRLILDMARGTVERPCINCNKKAYHTWFWYAKVLLDEFQMLPLCIDCAPKVQKWAEKKFKLESKEDTKAQKEPSELVSPRLVDTS